MSLLVLDRCLSPAEVSGTMAYEPEFKNETVTASSADPTYHPVAIQLYGHANKFNGTSTNHVRAQSRATLLSKGFTACNLPPAKHFTHALSVVIRRTTCPDTLVLTAPSSVH